MAALFKVLIVDDEPKGRRLIKSHLDRQEGFLLIGQASSVDEGISIISKELPDLIFLDINMPYKNGFELVKTLEKLKIDVKVIFVTAFEQYAIEAIKHNAFDYIVKPIRPTEFDEAIIKFKNKISSKPTNRLAKSNKIKFNQKNQTLFVDPDEIMYCRADGNYTKLWLDVEHCEIVSHHLKKMESILNHDFIRVGRSLLVNQKYLILIDRKHRNIELKKREISIQIQISQRQLHSFSQQ